MRTTLQIVAVLAILSTAAWAQDTRGENQERDRGQTPTADETQTLDRGRIGTQGSVPPKPVMLHGILVDAGCRNRSSLNLKRSPESVANTAPAGMANRSDKNSTGGESAHGITVDQKTIDAERSDVMEHQVLDLRSRQMDPTCAVTGATRGFALLTDNGRLLDLDEGGNSKAVEAVQASDAGRKMLSGAAPGFKPRATIKATIHGDRAMVDQLKLDRAK